MVETKMTIGIAQEQQSNRIEFNGKWKRIIIGKKDLYIFVELSLILKEKKKEGWEKNNERNQYYLYMKRRHQWNKHTTNDF